MHPSRTVFFRDDLGLRNLDLVTFATHHFDQDRELQLAASRDLELFGRLGLFYPQGNVAKQFAVGQPLI